MLPAWAPAFTASGPHRSDLNSPWFAHGGSKRVSSDVLLTVKNLLFSVWYHKIRPVATAQAHKTSELHSSLGQSSEYFQMRDLIESMFGSVGPSPAALRRAAFNLFGSLSDDKKKATPNGVAFFLAEDEGFEPPQTESESGVLPLHKSSKRRITLYPSVPKSQVLFFFLSYFFQQWTSLAFCGYYARIFLLYHPGRSRLCSPTFSTAASCPL